MSQPDLILLHAPSVYDFRKKPILYGPVSDVIPSSSVFEMYPLGMTSIADRLERAGYRVRIVNLAFRMMRDANFDAEAFIKKLNSPLFGIDLHWLVHAHGAIEIARLVKKHHPDSKLIFGGLSSSYFWKELFNYPEVDFVMRGDSTEEPMLQLMEALKHGSNLATVPNLAWRDTSGKVMENEFSHAPVDLGGVMLSHYTRTVRAVLRYRDIASYVPFQGWLDYPITALFTCRGCTQNCAICGGSAFAYKNSYHRPELAVRSPEMVLGDIRQIGRLSRGPIFMLGDIRQPGEGYANKLLDLIEKEHPKNQFILELFSPASREFLQRLGKVCPGFCLQISPESHDAEVRKAAGKNYSTEGLERTIGDVLDAGCGRLDIFFMIGIPGQTAQSALDTVDYCDHLYQKFNNDKRLNLFTAPLAPFLDPGSLGFEQPEKYGYKILFRSLEEHRQALAQPGWKHTLNYETKWMNRDQIVDVTYEAIQRLNELKARYGYITPEMAKTAEMRLISGRNLTHRVDELLTAGDEAGIAALKPEMDAVNMLPVNEKMELALPVGLGKLRFFSAFRHGILKRI